MNQKNLKCKYLSFGVIIGVAAVTAGLIFSLEEKWLQISSSFFAVGKSVDTILANGNVEVLTLINPTDYSVSRNLVGAADNVYIGRVISQLASREPQSEPHTQYKVEIIRNIKGALSGIVTVDQIGGHSERGLTIVEDFLAEDYLLHSGAIYLLATRFNETEDSQSLISHPSAQKLILESNEADMLTSSSEFKIDSMAREFEAVYPDEVPLDADIAHDRTPNSFQSLPPAEKAASQSRADAAKVWLAANVSSSVTSKSSVSPPLSATSPEVQSALNSASSGKPISDIQLRTLLDACKVFRVVDVTGNTESDYAHLHGYGNAVSLEDPIDLAEVQGVINSSAIPCVHAVLTAQVGQGMHREP